MKWTGKDEIHAPNHFSADKGRNFCKGGEDERVGLKE